ncbi:DNA polymerase III subunit delta [Bacteroidia bacterium]|nr:DNA polymerase III subunit delta [Bacteroidia bacterium]
MFFKDIIGQKEIKRRLIQSVKDGYIPHARLISGPEGVGKIALALAYARYLSCSNRREEDACGVCPSCIKYNKLSHPDLHFVFPIIKNDKKKKEVCDDYLKEWREFVLQNPYFNLSSWLNFIGAENSQGMIYAKESEEILRKLNLKAYESEYKIMIVWMPEKMHEACSNKLLKMIEEPPVKTVFLLISENPDRVIGTIQSRSQSLPVPPIAPEDLATAIPPVIAGLNRNLLNEEEISNLVHLANGSYLKALEVIETGEENQQYLNLFITIMRNCWKRDVKNMKSEAETFAAMGREKQKSFLAYAQNMIRENFLYRLNLPEINYLNPEEAGFSKNFSPYVNENNVIGLMDELALAERHVESNVNPRMIFFDLSMKIAVLIK